MPEGDTIFRIARRFRPVLEGQRLTHAEARWARAVEGVAGRTVTGIETVGKHMLVALDDDTLLRVHLGMTGRWWRGAPGAGWPRSPGDMGLVLETEAVQLVCFQPRPVERIEARRRRVHPVLRALGPDVLDDDVDVDEVLRRARLPAHADRDVGDLLLDQTVTAGIGNVYKSEALFLEHVHPWTAVGDMSDDALLAVFARARTLMRKNLGDAPRNTTGRRDVPLWIYGAMRRPCLVCGTEARHQHQGAQHRITWWCPRCQSGADVE